MAEKVLNNQLSGDEVIEAIADSVKTHLARTGYFRTNDAFDKFKATITMKVETFDTGLALPSTHTILAGKGESEADEPDGTLDTEFEIAPLPPNELRQATGQEIPVLTTDASGKRVQKGVKYARKGSAIVAMILLAILPSLAQTKPAPVKPVVQQQQPVGEQLTNTERVALRAIIAEQNQANQDGNQFMADVAKNHPGYHYDPKVNELVKDAPAEKK